MDDWKKYAIWYHAEGETPTRKTRGLAVITQKDREVVYVFDAFMRTVGYRGISRDVMRGGVHRIQMTELAEQEHF